MSSISFSNDTVKSPLDFRRVTKSNPCRICGKPDWCRFSEDGRIAICRREGDYDQERIDRSGQRFYVHRLRDDDYGSRPQRSADDAPQEPQQPRQKQPKAKARRSLPPEVITERLVSALERGNRNPDLGEHLNRLSHLLHLPRAALDALGCSYDLVGLDGHTRERWAWPARDGSETIIGISTRGIDGDKRTVKYTRLGLFVPAGWKERAEATGVVYAIEGPTDTAALWAAGLCAVGRPSNMAGAELLADLLKPIVNDRVAVVVVGERDEKDNGLWPGRDGALYTAEELANALRVDVRAVLPPEGSKDVREHFRVFAPPLDDAAAWAEVGGRLEASWETIDTMTPAQLGADFTPVSMDEMFPEEELRKLGEAIAAEKAEEARQAEERRQRFGNDAEIAHAMREASCRRGFPSCPQPLPPIIFGKGRCTIPHKIRRRRCGRWSCPACVKWRTALYMPNVQSRLHAAEKAGKELRLIAIPDTKRDRSRLVRQIQRNDAEHFTVHDYDRLAFVTTDTSQGGERITAAEAAKYIRARLLEWCGGCRSHPISASRNWKAPPREEVHEDERDIRLGQANSCLGQNPEEVHNIAEAAGFRAIPLPRTEDSARRGWLNGFRFEPIDEGMLQRPYDMIEAGDYLMCMLQAGHVIPADEWQEISEFGKRLQAARAAEPEPIFGEEFFSTA